MPCMEQRPTNPKEQKQMKNQKIKYICDLNIGRVQSVVRVKRGINQYQTTRQPDTKTDNSSSLYHPITTTIAYTTQNFPSLPFLCSILKRSQKRTRDKEKKKNVPKSIRFHAKPQKNKNGYDDSVVVVVVVVVVFRVEQNEPNNT